MVWLRLLQMRSSDEGVRRAAIQKLEDETSPRVVEALEAALSDKAYSVRAAAARTLGKTRNAETIKPLQRALADEYAMVREDVVQALQSIGGPEVVGSLITALKDKDEGVRKVAAAALTECKAPEAASALREYQVAEQVALQAVENARKAAMQKQAAAASNAPKSSPVKPPAKPQMSEEQRDLSAAPLSSSLRQLLWMDPKVIKLCANSQTLVQDGNRLLQIQYSQADVDWAEQVNVYAIKAEQASSANAIPEAIALYRKALQLAPGCDLYLMSIGCCYANMGDLRTGVKYLERAAEISPSQERIRRNLEGIRQALRQMYS